MRDTFNTGDHVAMFRKGDRVRALDGSHISHYSFNWVLEMAEYIGKILTIDYPTFDYRQSKQGYSMMETTLKFDERGLELVYSPLSLKFSMSDMFE